MTCPEAERKIRTHPLVQASQVQLLISAPFKALVAPRWRMELKLICAASPANFLHTCISSRHLSLLSVWRWAKWSPSPCSLLGEWFCQHTSVLLHGPDPPSLPLSWIMLTISLYAFYSWSCDFQSIFLLTNRAACVKREPDYILGIECFSGFHYPLVLEPRHGSQPGSSLAIHYSILGPQL